ncbi:Integrase, catalytic core protein, partial [Phytophthora megakarya]
MSALRAKGVIMEIPTEDVPKDAKPISTRWVRSLKTDRQGYVTCFKSRIVAFGNHQRPGSDFYETFVPVTRGDVNTAYLNALLGIRQYLKTIDGFPCATKGHMYGVMKALYGLRQSGREWNTEFNRWFLDQGYLRLLIEPAAITLVLTYVDDIMVATNSEEHKCKLFEKLDEVYGIKDQGLLTEYLGIEVDQADESVTLRQIKYAREILETFGYESAHAVGNRMETNVRMVPLDANEESASSFEYRKAIGMLMYMATGRRPGLAYAVGQLSRFVAKPSAKHMGTLKRVLRYLARTLDYGIKYRHSKGVP